MEETKIRKIRKSHKLSILKLAQLADLSFERMRQIDAGIRVKNLQFETKVKLASALGIPFFELWGIDLNFEPAERLLLLEALASYRKALSLRSDHLLAKRIDQLIEKIRRR